MEKFTKAERSALKKITSAAGKASAAKLTKAQRTERARAAGIASGKARGKNAKTKDIRGTGKP